MDDLRKTKLNFSFENHDRFPAWEELVPEDFTYSLCGIAGQSQHEFRPEKAVVRVQLIGFVDFFFRTPVEYQHLVWNVLNLRLFLVQSRLG